LHRFEERYIMKLAQTYEVTDMQRKLYIKQFKKLQKTVEDQQLKIENVNN